MRFTEPELIVIYEKNLDASAITAKFIEVCRSNLGKFVSYQISRENFNSDIDPESFLRQEKKIERIYPSHSYFAGKTAHGYGVMSSASGYHDGSWQPYLEVRADFSHEEDREVLREALRLLTRLANEYAEDKQVVGIQVRETSGGTWTPIVPGSNGQEYVRLLRQPENIRNFYQNVSDYWLAWDKRENIGGRVLVSRAFDIIDVEAFQEEIYPRTWGLARNAFPGECEYYPPNFAGIPSIREQEMKLFYQGEKCLSWVGYDPDKQIALASCYAEEGIHIPPHEILGMHQIITSSKMPDGKPVKTLQIVFPSKEMAMREGVPLLDIGAKVLYIDLEMKNVELTGDDFRQRMIH